MSSALKHSTPEKLVSGRPPAGPNATPPTTKRAPSITSAKTPDKGTDHGSNIGRRRSSVQFTEDTKKEDQMIRRPSVAKDANGAFRQNMSDFLTVMYGADGKTVATTTKPPVASSGRDNPLQHNRASMYKSAASNGGSGAAVTKGPLVKGKTAHDGVDNIDTLVDHLVRAYSRKSTGSGFGTTGGGVGDAPVSYGGKKTISPSSSRQRAGHSSEVSEFVSQAMDGFLDNNLTSKRSMLSSLGVDQNFAKLLSFHQDSNMAHDNDDSDNSLLEPRKVGEQAMFKSIGSRPNQHDASVSKSVEMRGFIPPPPAGEEVMTGLSAPKGKARAGNTSDMSLNSAQLAAPKRPAQPKGKSLARPISLDSKALGGHLEADDSWGDVDAEAAELNKKEKEKEKAKAADSAVPAAPAVSNMRSLMNYSKEKAALMEAVAKLEEEEELNRNVTIAVEKQLRGYLVTGVKQTPKGPPAGTGAKGKLPAGKGPTVGTRKISL